MIALVAANMSSQGCLARLDRLERTHTLADAVPRCKPHSSVEVLADETTEEHLTANLHMKSRPKDRASVGASDERFLHLLEVADCWWTDAYVLTATYAR